MRSAVLLTAAALVATGTNVSLLGTAHAVTESPPSAVVRHVDALPEAGRGGARVLVEVPGWPDYTAYAQVLHRAAANRILTRLRGEMYARNFEGHDDVALAIFQVGVGFAVEFIVAYRFID